MRRSGWTTGAIAVHLLFALVMAAICIYTLYLTRTPEIREGPDAAEAIYGLRIGALVVSIPAVALFVSVVGLLRSRLWGWWLALVVDVGLAAVFVYDTLDEGWSNVDHDDVAMMVVFLLLAAGLILPAVRNDYWAAGRRAASVTTHESPTA